MFLALSVLSALPPLPHGSRLALTAPGWGRGVGTGGAVWPAAEVLARWLLDERKTVQGARVLELGSGTGAVGLFAAGCGASSVLLTDGDASLCSLAADNARNNAALMPDATVTTMRYRWGGSVEALGGPFDLALASDLTYEPAAHGAPVVYKLVAAAPHGVCPLMHTIGLLLEAPSPPRVLLGHMHRPLTSVLKGSGCMDHLFAAAEKRGVSARELHVRRQGFARVSLIEMTRGASMEATCQGVSSQEAGR